ncbi:MAG TPA: tetratricopeptide repeat protein [Vicinamibacterales bacterium]|jgi:tetratricopeptide (TPR) repeat protein|nr:tetratricopeptide repeat protein [Vicinamibacterales bacterium]
MIAALMAAALALGLRAPQPVAAVPPPRILVVPFDTPVRDGRTYWLGEAVGVLITDDLNARGLGAIGRPVRVRAYEHLHLPANTVLSRATVIKIGELVGATQVVVGDVQVDGDALTIRARPIHIDVGRGDSEVVEKGRLVDLFALAQKVARRAIPGGGSGIATLPSSLHAFEQYMKGLLAEQPASQASFLEAALKLDSRYDAARFALWDIRTAQGDHAAALAAIRGVADASPVARRAKFLSAVSLMALKQNDDAFAALKGLQDAGPDPAILNNLGIVQLRRGGSQEAGKPTYFLTKAAEALPDDPDVLFNLGYAYALDRDPQGAIYWLREALRRNPADGDAHFVIAAELEASGSEVEAGRERELATQLSARRLDAQPHAPVPRGLERVAQDLEASRGGGVDQALTTTALRDQQNVAQFYLERGRRLFDAEQDREAMLELRRAVFLSPYEAEAHLLMGRIHLRGGRPREAVDALKISIWSRDTAPARVALGEAYLKLKDATAARAQAQRALQLDPGSAEAKALLDRIDRGIGGEL